MMWSTIWPLVVKDLTIFFRNRFFAFISVLGLVAYAGIYLAMPTRVDETIGLGLYTPTMPEEIARLLDEETEPLLLAPSEEALQQAVLDGEISGGFALPEDLFEQLKAGQSPAITIYLPSEAPDDMRHVMVVLVEAMVLSISGAPLNIDFNEEVLGPDMVGQQIPMRDRMLPLFIIISLMMETLGLASLIAQEIQTQTLRALLVTPMGVSEVVVSKGLTSVLMTFTQATLLMAIIGGLQNRVLIILTTLLLGSLLATGIGFLMGAAGKDMLSVLGLGILVIALLSIPPIGVVFPGAFTGWSKIIPSYYLADTIHQVANMNAGWSQVWRNLLILLGIDILLFWLGVVILKRKFT